MAGKLNFAIALKMTTDQFKKGTDFVKRSLKSMQYQVLGMVSAFGLGAVGLKGLTSELIRVARETNRASSTEKTYQVMLQGLPTT